MSFDAGFLCGYHYGKSKGGDGDNLGRLTEVSGSGGELTIAFARGEYHYTYDEKTISKTVKTLSHSSSGTSVSASETFSRTLVDKLYNSKGEVILSAVYADEAAGKVSHYLDKNGEIIHIGGGNQ